MAILRSLVVLLFLATFCFADDPSANYCNPATTIPSTSPVSANIDHLLADIVSKFQHGAQFVLASSGQDPNQVYGLAQCRADVGPADCWACIQDAAQQVRKLCPKQSDSRIWYDHCFLRYSQEKFYGNLDTSWGMLFANVENVTDPESFNKELGNMFDKISSKAAKLPMSKGIGKDQKKVSNFDTLYGLVQCTRDLSPLSCAQCLATAIQNFQGFCLDKKGCRVLYSSCYVRYELYPFFFPLDSHSTKGADAPMKKSIIYH